MQIPNRPTWLINGAIGVLSLTVLDIASGQQSDFSYERAPTAARVNVPLDEQMELWKSINNSVLPSTIRAEAERSLLRARDANMLRAAFHSLAAPIEVITLPDPTSGRESKMDRIPMERSVATTPGTGLPEADTRLPISAQVGHARIRIFAYLAQYAEPEETRQTIFVELIKEAETEFQMRQLPYLARSNWTPAVRRELLLVVQNSARSAAIRASAARALVDTFQTSKTELRETQDQITTQAWSERGSEFALAVSSHVDYRDPRGAVLRLDGYERELQNLRNRNQLPSSTMVDNFDRCFNNASGKYRPLDWRMPVDERERETQQREQRQALIAEAQKTGDYAKVHEFDAKIAEEERKTSEERVAKIDAWIAANRERLEREARDFDQKKAKPATSSP